ESSEGEGCGVHGEGEAQDEAGPLTGATVPVVAVLDDAGEVTVTIHTLPHVPAGTRVAEPNEAAAAEASDWRERRQREAGVSVQIESDVPAGTQTADVPAGTQGAGVSARTQAAGVSSGAQTADSSSGTQTGDVPAGTRGSRAEPESSAPHPGFQRMPGGRAVVEEFEGQEWSESAGARRADALRLLAESYLAGGWRQLASGTPIDISADRYQVVVHIDHALLAADRHESPQSTLPLERCAVENGVALSPGTIRRLACESALVGMIDDESGEPLSVGRKTRAIPPALRRALHARDGGCRFPGCDRTLLLHAHHVVHWADGGETKLSNLLSLCTFHHWLLHEGGFTVEAADDGDFVFYDPTGKPLPATGRLSRRTVDALARAAAEKRVTIKEANSALGIRISAETAACRWAGERMDYYMAVDGLIWRRNRARKKTQH